MEHVKFCVKIAGPSAKAKYTKTPIVNLVPWGKGEKNPVYGSEIDPETVYKQPARASTAMYEVMVCLLKNDPAS